MDKCAENQKHSVFSKNGWHQVDLLTHIRLIPQNISEHDDRYECQDFGHRLFDGLCFVQLQVDNRVNGVDVGLQRQRPHQQLIVLRDALVYLVNDIFCEQLLDL
jgi:hypothetical protein